jgi:Zn-dependent protease
MKALFFILFSGLKWGKIATSGGSMLLSLVVYATIWGWRYAAGFIALLFAHEMGHYVAARQRGLNVGAPTFIPFVGAWIALKDQPRR